MTECTESWQALLNGTRAYNRDPGARYDLRTYFRAQSYRRTQDLPRPVAEAMAFEAVLDGVTTATYPGELIAGSRAGFTAPTLPAGILEAAYDEATAYHKSITRRDFTAGFDHTLPDYPTLLSLGIGGILSRINSADSATSDPEKRIFYKALLIVMNAFSRFIARYSAASRKSGNLTVAAVLDKVTLQPPATLHEAMQLVWLTHIAMVSEGRFANALGRIDQYLAPFYNADLAAGRVTRPEALKLFCHLWAKIEELGEVTNIAVGGLTPDGRDATNELSYICIEATALIQSPHSNLSARFHQDTPERFHRACFDCIKTGVGFPAIFNDDVLIRGLCEIGIPAPTARDYCMVGCIETMLPGRQPPWSDSRFNTPLYLLSAVRKLGSGANISYDRLVSLFESEVRSALEKHADSINAHIAKFPAALYPDPFLSALTHDCIARGLDVNAGGAEFPRFHGIGVMGLATVTDSLAAIRKLVFEDKSVDYATLLRALDGNFKGQEPLRQQLINRAPKYGNADAQTDAIAARIVTFVAEECLRLKMADGGRFVAAMAGNTSNISAGKRIGATPDGRPAETPLSDAASPYFGRDKNGPTAFLRSVAAPDYHLVLTGSVINMKFDPAHFSGEAGASRFSAVTHALIDGGIQELQFNFTSNQVLLEAQAHPGRHGDLVVRVSGFSAYFTRLSREVQDDIIRRRAHG